MRNARQPERTESNATTGSPAERGAGALDAAQIARLRAALDGAERAVPDEVRSRLDEACFRAPRASETGPYREQVLELCKHLSSLSIFPTSTRH